MGTRSQIGGVLRQCMFEKRRSLSCDTILHNSVPLTFITNIKMVFTLSTCSNRASIALLVTALVNSTSTYYFHQCHRSKSVCAPNPSHVDVTGVTIVGSRNILRHKVSFLFVQSRLLFLSNSPIESAPGESSSASAAENSQRQDLLDKASRLRREAEDLESQLRQSRMKGERGGIATEKGLVAAEPVRDIGGSTWTFFYRFSEKPEAPDDKNDEEIEQKRVVYSGKLGLRFRSDGYTDVILHEPRPISDTGEETKMKYAAVVKAWGWDVEKSSDDGEDYLMFSVDVLIPPDDDYQQREQRFYFQAKLDREASTGIVSLKGGTVAIKQDAVQAKAIPGLWGLFSPGGILAQFRYVGDFAVRNR